MKTEATEMVVLTRQFNGQDYRIIIKDGTEWFVAKDVCDILELKRVDTSVRRLRPIEKATLKVSTLGGIQTMTTVTESGFYALILKSNKPDAEEFRFKVTSEILPAIRKTGGYSVAQQATPMEMKEFMEQLMTQFKEEVRKELVEVIDEKAKALNTPRSFPIATVKSYKPSELGRLCHPYLHAGEVMRILEGRELVRAVDMPKTSGSLIGWIPTERAQGFYVRDLKHGGRKSATGEFVPNVRWLGSVLGLPDPQDI